MSVWWFVAGRREAASAVALNALLTSDGDTLITSDGDTLEWS